MRDHNGVQIHIGDTVQVIAPRKPEQPVGIVIAFDASIVRMRAPDGNCTGWYGENVTVLDSDLQMDEGL